MVSLPGFTQLEVHLGSHLSGACRHDRGLQWPVGWPGNGPGDRTGGLPLVPGKPHANYLITLVAGYFKKLEAKQGMSRWRFNPAVRDPMRRPTSFRDTQDMMAFFEDEIGVPYPWAKYDQVCVNDFVAGGMENTSATTLTDSTLFTDATENLRTAKDSSPTKWPTNGSAIWSPARIGATPGSTKGFATFYETLYLQHKHGRDAMLYEFYQRARNITGISEDTNAIVRRNFHSPDECSAS